jgi:hypothetical protein
MHAAGVSAKPTQAARCFAAKHHPAALLHGKALCSLNETQLKQLHDLKAASSRSKSLLLPQLLLLPALLLH